MSSASLLRSRLCASSCDFCVRKYSRLAFVARRAFFLGRRKLRAKPSLTFTSSPIWPSFSTRSSKITCISGFPSAQHVGQQRHIARALDRLRKQALLARRDGGDAAWHDLAALGDEALQQLHVLVVDLGRIGAREGAGLLATKEGSSLTGLAHAKASSTATTGSAAPSGFSARSSRRFLLDDCSNCSTLTVR